MNTIWAALGIAAILSAVFGPWVAFFKMKDLEGKIDALKAKIDWVDDGVAALLEEGPPDDDPDGGLPVEERSNIIPFDRAA